MAGKWGAGQSEQVASKWKYINVRRLFIFIEEPNEEGTQWAVFEPNHEPTWPRVKRPIANFLTAVWRDAPLINMGSVPMFVMTPSLPARLFASA